MVFSKRNECTRVNPVKVEVGEGEHVMVGVASPSIYDGLLMHVSCSNITIVGRGKGKTIVHGGFRVKGKQHVRFEKLTITNPHGSGRNTIPIELVFHISGLLLGL